MGHMDGALAPKSMLQKGELNTVGLITTVFKTIVLESDLALLSKNASKVCVLIGDNSSHI